jgi:hypothetical protein
LLTEEAEQNQPQDGSTEEGGAAVVPYDTAALKGVKHTRDEAGSTKRKRQTGIDIADSRAGEQ